MRFLEIVTRTYKRPTMLAANQASVAALTDQDLVHTILRDDTGIGVAAANARLALHEPNGQYLWVLDDDDVCIHAKLVEHLKELARLHNPGAVMVRMDHGPELGILPKLSDWWETPKEAGIGCSALITRRDAWLAHRHAWASGRYAADFDFISSVWANKQWLVVWLDVIASRVQRISHGLPEAA